MKRHPTEIPDVVIFEPAVHEDGRGAFFESFNQRAFDRHMRRSIRFVQDNHSYSLRGVLRGLHYQVLEPQGKLLRVVRGEVFDVAVDVRRGSPTFGKWTGTRLSAANRLQVWIPEGFAHGFLVLSESADVLYKTTGYYAREHERCIRWDDPDLAIRWPLACAPVVSERDARAPLFRDAEVPGG